MPRVLPAYRPKTARQFHGRKRKSDILTDISQMAPKRRPIEGKIAVWDGIAQPDFGVLALSAAP